MAESLTTGIWNGAPPREPGGGDNSGGRGASRRVAFTGLWVLLAAIVMFFAALTSTYVVRRGLGNDWVTTPLPPVLWVNTAVLVLSSAALELARRALKSGARLAFNGWWSTGTLLGLLFLAGQYYAWRQLWAAGIYLPTNPSASLFYVFTGAHAVHLVGGVVALLYVNAQALRLRLGPGKRTAADVSAVYWHFLDGLWIYLLVIFLIWG